MASVSAEEPGFEIPAGYVVGGRYRIDELLGRGGMGVVYKAVDTLTSQTVAVKLLGGPRTPEAHARFEREAERMQRLEHANIVRLLDCGRDKQGAFIAMEYIDGEPLHRYVARKGFVHIKDFVPMAVQILEAAGHVHNQHVMIRDIKPENLMICERAGLSNFVMMLDFGLARQVETATSITVHAIVGTTAYLSPESVRGEKLDLRVDVYALGVLFYFMLSGRLPIAAENAAAILYRHVHMEPQPLMSVLPEGQIVPEGLAQLIHACLAKDRSARPNDANEVLVAMGSSVPAKFMERRAADASGASSTNLMHRSKLGEVAPTGELSSQDVRPWYTRPAGGVALLVATVALGSGALVAVLAGPSGSMLRGLDRAEALLEAGRFDEAGGALSGVRGHLESEPEYAARVGALQERIDKLQRLESGQAFEQAGDVVAAAAAYREVLAGEPANAVAQAGLERALRPPDPPSVGRLKIDATVPARVVVNGKVLGPTPVERDLPPGDHHITVVASGYEPWAYTAKLGAQEKLHLVADLVLSTEVPIIDDPARLDDPEDE